jgi:hypothetical protein
VIRGNYYHDNAAGIWMDTDNVNYLIESNLSIRTQGRRGIESEQDCGGGVIRYNWSEGNDQTGILITASQGDEVYGNIVKDNGGGAEGGGIIVAHQFRGSGACEWTVKNTFIHDNWIVPRIGTMAAGIFLYNTTDTAILSSSDDRVRFQGNKYYVPDTAGRFWLLGFGGATKTWSEWTTAGNDTVGGSVTKYP